MAPKPGGRRCGTPSSEDSASSSLGEGGRSGGETAVKRGGGGASRASSGASAAGACAGTGISPGGCGAASGARLCTTRKSSWPASELLHTSADSPVGSNVRSESSSRALSSGSAASSAGCGSAAARPGMVDACPMSLGRWCFRASTIRAVMSSSAGACCCICSCCICSDRSGTMAGGASGPPGRGNAPPQGPLLQAPTSRRGRFASGPGSAGRSNANRGSVACDSHGSHASRMLGSQDATPRGGGGIGGRTGAAPRAPPATTA
mmetsp:Transcript_107744/g.347843  ORF Transcript_107744/g.347843 Transcript_107744/m.347843 type:complete len:263 (-) Transcript_107744:2-790(-)